MGPNTCEYNLPNILKEVGLLMPFSSTRRLKTHDMLNLLVRFMLKLELKSILLIRLLASYSREHQFSICSESVKLFGVIFQVSDCPCLSCNVLVGSGMLAEITCDTCSFWKLLNRSWR